MRFKDKKYLITGGTGTLGKALINRLLHEGVAEIRIFSRDEYKQSEMIRENKDGRVTFWLGDVRDLERIKEATEGIDVVIHAAAMKRMDSISHNASYLADVNINGTNNVMLAGKNCDKVIFISTDKAFQPENLYGATKMVAEGIVLSKKNGVVWRFGNFIGSRGSVWEIFKKQSERGEKLTITDPDATRFVIDINMVCEYVISDAEHGMHYPDNLHSMTVREIADTVSHDSLHKIIGLREGEKLHESFNDKYSSKKYG